MHTCVGACLSLCVCMHMSVFYLHVGASIFAWVCVDIGVAYIYMHVHECVYRSIKRVA